jgi:hypothetical protein
MADGAPVDVIRTDAAGWGWRLEFAYAGPMAAAQQAVAHLAAPLSAVSGHHVCRIRGQWADALGRPRVVLEVGGTAEVVDDTLVAHTLMAQALAALLERAAAVPLLTLVGQESGPVDLTTLTIRYR